MITFLTTSGLAVANQYPVSTQSSVDIAIHHDPLSDFQFEVVAPDKVFLPAPGKSREFKIGLKITNNTIRPKYFCLCSVEPEIVTEDNVPIESILGPIKRRLPIRRDDFQEIFPRKNVVYYFDVIILNQNKQRHLTFLNPDGSGYDFQGLLPGKYKISLLYSNIREKFPAIESRGKKYGAIRNIWVGNITPPAKDIVLVDMK